MPKNKITINDAAQFLRELDFHSAIAACTAIIDAGKTAWCCKKIKKNADQALLAKACFYRAYNALPSVKIDK